MIEEGTPTNCAEVLPADLGEDDRPSFPALPTFIAYWYEALSAEHGICIRASTPELLPKLRERLYEARRKCNDPDLWLLQVRSSHRSPKTELWLQKEPEWVKRGRGEG